MSDLYDIARKRNLVNAALVNLVEVETMDAGLQPLDALLSRLEIPNHALVENSDEHLTHKVVQKARKGRKVTRNAQQKILRALNTATGRNHSMEDIFNYRGR